MQEQPLIHHPRFAVDLEEVKRHTRLWAAMIRRCGIPAKVLSNLKHVTATELQMHR